MSKPNDDQDEREDSRWVLRAYREMGPFIGLGLQMAVAIVLFFFAGRWLDGRYGTSPWFALSGVVLAGIGVFIKFFKTVANLGDGKEPTK